MNCSPALEVLEVGGGTGSFARSFIKQAANLNATRINYHILDFSPALMENQRKILSGASYLEPALPAGCDRV